MPSYDPSDYTGFIVLLLLVDQSQTNFVTGPRSLGVVPSLLIEYAFDLNVVTAVCLCIVYLVSCIISFPVNAVLI
jgi:hypothetical protein